MIADRQSGRLFPAWSPGAAAAGVLALGAMAGGLVVVADAPGQVEHTRIVISGGDRAAGVTALIDALLQQGPEPPVDPVARPDGVQIDRRLPADGVEPDPPGAVLAARAVAAATAALRPAAAAAPALAPDRITPELVAQRASLQAARDEADRSATSQSTALTDVVRDTATMQALDALAPEQSGSGPQPEAVMRKMLADLELRRIDLAARYTADYPGIAIADSEIDGLKALLAKAARTRPVHPDAAALATLGAEQLRLQTALQDETALRDDVTQRITALDRMIAEHLAPPQATPPPAPAAAFRATIIPLPQTRLPDQRPVADGAIAACTLLAAWWLGRRRHTPHAGLAGRIQAIEHMVQLPVLRCLDTEGQSKERQGQGLRPWTPLGPEAPDPHP